jgi:predicted PurR-regulated permease PerM
MGFWISAVIALLLAALAAPPIARLHGLGLPAPEILALLATAFAVAGLLSRGRRNRVSD